MSFVRNVKAGRERERVGGIEKRKSGQTEGERNVREEREGGRSCKRIKNMMHIPESQFT